MALNSGGSGHVMDNEYLTIIKTFIGKNCIFDHFSASIGGQINDNSVFTNITFALNGYICRGNAIYSGIPCKKIGEYSDLSSADINEIKRKIRKIDKKNFLKDKNSPIKINETKLSVMKFLIIIGGCIIALIIPYLYSLFYQTFYSPTNHLLNIALLTLVPPLFLITLGFFIVGICLLIKLLIVYYDKKAEIPEGYYELDDPRAKLFKIKYSLRIFGIKLFHGTPFKILDTLAMRLWGNAKLGKFVEIDYAIVDPQYIEVGDNTQIGQRARIHTHDFVDGKLYVKKVKIGKRVLIGGLTHISPGVEIADNSMSGIGAWFETDRICKKSALWVGKPVSELPIEFVRKSTQAKERYID
jgi:acetyltransferase-like isoleucine patch superfamily enzyme